MDPVEFERDVGRLKHHLRRTFVAGLIFLVPTTVTLWVLFYLFDTVDAILGNVLARATGIRIPGLGLLLTLLLVYGIGLVASNVGGKRILAAVEGFVDRLPLARGVYRVVKEVSLAFGQKEKRPFREVVLLEFPRKGIWTVGFLTAEVPERTPAPEGSVYIFVPTTPNPTSGWLLMVPEDSLVRTDYTVDEGMRIVISAGIVGPAHVPQGPYDAPVGAPGGAVVVPPPGNGGAPSDAGSRQPTEPASPGDEPEDRR
jgi:uncharacterized membrane protein